MDKETAEMLRREEIEPSTKNLEFNYVTHQRSLALEWFKDNRKCGCELDETSDDCKHMRKALRKLYGHRIDKMWNELTASRFRTFNELTGFQIPFALQERLSAKPHNTSNEM